MDTFNVMQKLSLSAVAALLILSPPSALAGSYEALCGGVKCTVNVSSQGIRSPQGAIPPSRISYWSVNGESSTSVGTGIATTLLLGGIGLLGFLAKNHDFDFTIDGYDSEGRKVGMQFKFINSKPVKRLTTELYRISGLAMGRQRTIAEIQAIESGEAPLNATTSTVEPALAATKKPKQLDCGRVLQDYGCNYDAYLDANPSVKAWAEANPDLAEKERVRLGAFTEEELKENSRHNSNNLQEVQPALGALEGYVSPSTPSGTSATEEPLTEDSKPTNCIGLKRESDSRCR